MKVLLLLIVVGQCLAQEEDKCPNTDISPCSCTTYFDGACILTCSLASQAQIEKIADIPNLCNGHVHFVLVHSKIAGIPARLWKTLLSSKTVDITIKHSGIEGLVPPGGGAIPQVNTPGPAVIKFAHSKVGKWDWAQFKNFYSEQELVLVIDDTPLAELSPDFAQIGSGQVHKVTIDSSGLTKIPDEVFANFRNLESLSLQNNQLKSVSRSLMPKPANKLEFLALNGNDLTDLPGDLFKDMPVLEAVYLRDNKIKTLPEELFTTISSNQIQRIDLISNPWECDCRLMRILHNTKQRVNLGVCATPSSLTGKKVQDLPQLLNC